MIKPRFKTLLLTTISCMFNKKGFVLNMYFLSYCSQNPRGERGPPKKPPKARGVGTPPFSFFDFVIP